ncbi:unnamed protein product, partial [Brassica rapa subsp. narinosa]
LWKSVVGRTFVRFVGVTRSDEIVRVDIQGMEAFMGFQIFTLQDHIEDVRLMKV